MHVFVILTILVKSAFFKKPLLIGFSIPNGGLLNRIEFDLHKNHTNSSYDFRVFKKISIIFST